MKKPELLLPANNVEVLKTAVFYGADAVYIGGEAFSLRAGAKNATNEELKEGIEFAHAHGAKVFITANILAHNGDLEEARVYFLELKEIRPDALIISDPGLVMIAKEVCPEIEIHISTQANNTNYATYNFWYKMGAKRVVAARELSLKELAEIREKIPADLDIETFVHGAMCIGYSGRCLVSNYLTGRDGNRGECTHPCRWKYAVMEETRPGEYFPVEENERGTFLFNSKDLCMIDHLDDLVASGTSSLKIEGRMKTALYVATMARTYRKALDDLAKDPALYQANMDWYKGEIGKGTNRTFTTGFFYGKPTEQDQIYDSNTYVTDYVYIGTMGKTDENGRICFEQKNKFSVGETMEIMMPNGDNIETTVLEIASDDGTLQESAPHARQSLHVKFSVMPDEHTILRRKA